MDERESIVPKFCISEGQKAKLIWMSDTKGFRLTHALDVLLSYYKQLGEDRDLHDLNSVMRLSKELKMRELSAKDVHRFMQMMRALAESKQTLDHLDTALEILPALERTGLTPGSVPDTDTIQLAARLTANGVTVTEVKSTGSHVVSVDEGPASHQT